MILNFWRPYPNWKPRKEGWYQCTVRNEEDPTITYVLDLYFRPSDKKWIDKRRQRVFYGYKVYKAGREPLEYNRVHTDRLCERDDVIAWKKLPRVYHGKRRGENHE